MSWYEEAFSRDYLLIYPHRNEAEALAEVEFAIRACNLRPPLRILDICCGYGRHSALFASKGFSVVGCDLSADLLKLFAQRIDGLPSRPQIVRGDARILPFQNESFSAVLSFFQSFGYFETPSEDAKVIDEAARALKPGGRLMLDLMNPDYALATLKPISISAAAGMKMIQRRRYDALQNKIIKTITVSLGKNQEKTWREEVRLYRQNSIMEFFKKSGLKTVDWYGSFSGANYVKGSPRMIAIAKK